MGFQPAFMGTVTPRQAGRLNFFILILKLRLGTSLETQCKPGTRILLKRRRGTTSELPRFETIAPPLNMAGDCMFGEIDFERWKRCNEEEKCLLQPTCIKL